jgi:hypothetical protein
MTVQAQEAEDRPSAEVLDQLADGRDADFPPYRHDEH